MDAPVAVLLWAEKDLLKVLDAVRYLHSLNVLLGDINARNILVKSERSVFLVDCDSYQVEGFPCPVGMPPYLAPELHGRQLRSTLRTVEHERFAIATLVFMLLHPGKPPYSHQGGEDPSKNVRKQHFPYPLGEERRSEGVPGGAWRFMWSHLPYYMKEAFHRAFTDGDRLPTEEWIELLGRYDSDLRKGYVSDEAFPSGFKTLNREQAESQGLEWKSCSNCGTGFGAKQPHHTMCSDCAQKRFSKQKAQSSASSRTRSATQSPPRRPSQGQKQSSTRKQSQSNRPRATTPRNQRPPSPQPAQQQGALSAVMKFLNSLFS